MLKSSAPNKTDGANSHALNINNSYRIIWNSSTNPEIKNVIEPFGYSENKLLEGKKLYKSIRNIQNALNVTQRWRRNAEERLSEAKDAAYQTIRDLQRTVRKAASTPGTSNISEVDMETLTTSSFLSCAYAVLKKVENIPESNTELSQSTHAAAKRKLERSKIISLDNANQIVEAANTSVNKAIAELDEATATFRSWFAQYLTILKVALRGNKKLLDKIDLDTMSR